MRSLSAALCASVRSSILTSGSSNKILFPSTCAKTRQVYYRRCASGASLDAMLCSFCGDHHSVYRCTLEHHGHARRDPMAISILAPRCSIWLPVAACESPRHLHTRAIPSYSYILTPERPTLRSADRSEAPLRILRPNQYLMARDIQRFQSVFFGSVIPQFVRLKASYCQSQTLPAAFSQ